MKRFRNWRIGIRVITNNDGIFKYPTPKEVSANKSAHYSKCYYWLIWYFYKVRTCDLCGKEACGKGLIRYLSNNKEKTIAYFCPDCSKRIPELKNKAKKYCRKCTRDCKL